MQNMENYMQRLAELVLTGMGSEILSCCISSTAICVEVRHPAQGGDGGVPVGSGELSMGFLGCHISTAGICSLKA
jgi:hypothetical protein